MHTIPSADAPFVIAAKWHGIAPTKFLLQELKDFFDLLPNSIKAFHFRRTRI